LICCNAATNIRPETGCLNQATQGATSKHRDAGLSLGVDDFLGFSPSASTDVSQFGQPSRAQEFIAMQQFLLAADTRIDPPRQSC
jgi:hypothetical protein